MTDEQIIKGLECCAREYPASNEICAVCDYCPYETQYPCGVNLSKDALALIKRQREEIDGLRKEVDYWVEEVKITRDDLNQSTAEARAEAIRTLQDRLAMHFGTYTDIDTVSVRDVFKLISKISEEILEE